MIVAVSARLDRPPMRDDRRNSPPTLLSRRRQWQGSTSTTTSAVEQDASAVVLSPNKDNTAISCPKEMKKRNEQQQHLLVQAQLRTTSRLALANLLFNLLRPDNWLPLAVRLPRAMWEIAIAMTCFAYNSNTTASSGSAVVLLLVSIMTLSTALVDMFVAAPIAALFVQWETCTGGLLLLSLWQRTPPRRCYADRVKGFGRLLVTLQCAATGIVYLQTAIVAWDAYQRHQRKDTIQMQQQAMQQVLGGRSG